MRTYVRLGLLVAVVLALAVLAGGGTPAYAWTAPAALNTNAATDSGSDYDPQVTTDGAGNWVAVWNSSENLSGTIGTDADVFVARSTDNGLTWTPPAALNTNSGTDSGDDYHPQVATDGGGNWVAVWDSTDSLGGTIGTDFDILVARSTDNGTTWTAPAALNTNAASDSGSDGSPQVTTDGHGHWVAVWHSNENLGGTIGTDHDILVARSTDDGETWTAPAVLNTNAATDSGWDWDWNPELSTDGTAWVAVWHSSDDLGGTIGTDHDILVARSTDNGATWTAAAALNTNAATDSGEDFRPRVATDGGSNWLAVWQSHDSLGGSIGADADIVAARSTDNGATWTAPAALNTNAGTDSGSDYYPDVATDGAGNWVAIWISTEDLGGIGTDYDILVARSTDSGTTWTAPVALNTNAATDSGRDWLPHLGTDGGGNWLAVWHSNEDLGGTIGTDPDILVARSTDDGATWTAATALNTNAGTDGGSDWYTQVTTDGGGHWATVWTSNDSLGDTIGSDGDILVARSTDNGATWSEPAALNTNAATDSRGDGYPQVTTDGGGNWVAVWDSGEDLGGAIGTDYDILVARSTDNGATWTAPAALNTNAATDSVSEYDSLPQVTTDGGGNWVAVWHSTEPNVGSGIGTDYDILYATDYIPPYPPVGGIAELPEVSDSAGRNYAVLAGLAAAAVVALGAGGWYARRRWVR